MGIDSGLVMRLHELLKQTKPASKESLTVDY